MDFYEVVDRVIDLLKQRGRASYRALKVQFKLDPESLEALKEELIEVHRLAIDQDGRMLVWNGETEETPITASQLIQTSEPFPARQDQPAQASPTGPPTPDAERRQLTVMFCDPADSTKLSGQLDPEDMP